MGKKKETYLKRQADKLINADFKEQYEDSIKRAKEIRKKMIEEMHDNNEESVEAQSYTDINMRCLSGRIERLTKLYKEIEREIDSIKDELAEMQKSKEETIKEEVKIQPPNKRWRAEMGEPYYYLLSKPSVGLLYEIHPCSISYERYDNMDNYLYSIGNYFKTKEEAEFEYERLKVVKELCEWVTPYRSKGLYAFYPHMSDTTKRFKIDIAKTSVPPLDFLYFESEKIAKNAIKAVGEDRILKYYYRLNIDEEN